MYFHGLQINALTFVYSKHAKNKIITFRLGPRINAYRAKIRNPTRSYRNQYVQTYSAGSDNFASLGKIYYQSFAELGYTNRK